jgi:methylmalonyl-CoA epimerase
VNKADREGVDRTVGSIEALLSLETFGPNDWRPPIVKTEATTGKGVPELLDEIDRFRQHPAASQARRRRERAEWRLRELIAQRFTEHVERRVLGAGEFERILDRIAARETDPYTVADDALRRALGGVEPDRGGSGELTVDHIGIAVSSIDEALAFYRDALGLEIEDVEEVPSERVRTHFITPAATGGTALELLEATDAASPIAKYVAKRGPGLHHITLRITDIHGALKRLKARGVRIIGDAPRPGAHGSLVAFVHPSSAHGVLVELKQSKGNP